MNQWRNRSERWQRVSLTVFLGLIMAGITMFALWSSTFAANIASGAGGCGEFVPALQAAQNGDAIIQMVGQKPSEGAVITKDLRISGGWAPNPVCDTTSQYFTTTEDIADFGFTYLAPAQRAELENGSGPVIKLDDINSPTFPNLDKLIIENVAFRQSGFPLEDGGGISGVISDGANILLDNILVEFSEIGSADGGGLKLDLYGASHLHIQDSQFSDDAADNNGGGLSVELYGGSYLTIENSLFANNSALNGGAFEITVNEGSHVAILNSTFISNQTYSTNGYGGAGYILINDGTVMIDGTTFEANDAGSRGGALYVQMDGGDITVKNSTFSSNEADESGGALYVESIGSASAKVHIINSTFNANSLPNQFVDNGFLETSVLSQPVYIPAVMNNTVADYKYARITGISITNDLVYSVDFETYNFEPDVTDVHVHFFFDTVAPEDAGTPGPVVWKLYGGPSPFTGYTFADRPFGPDGAEKLCILVANPNHSVRLGTGNCVKLP